MVIRDRDADSNGSLEERLYVVQDANLNVTCTINTSATVQERMLYDPNGSPKFFTSAYGSPTDAGTKAWIYLHQGGRFDQNSKLFHFRNREHHPYLGRWMQRDPLGYSGQRLNLYDYLLNSPASKTDSNGLQADSNVEVTKDHGKLAGNKGIASMTDRMTITIHKVDFKWKDSNKSYSGAAAIGVDYEVFGKDAPRFDCATDCCWIQFIAEMIERTVGGKTEPLDRFPEHPKYKGAPREVQTWKSTMKESEKNWTVDTTSLVEPCYDKVSARSKSKTNLTIFDLPDPAWEQWDKTNVEAFKSTMWFASYLVCKDKVYAKVEWQTVVTWNRKDGMKSDTTSPNGTTMTPNGMDKEHADVLQSEYKRSHKGYKQ
jgi:RHS repeat-associated protein